MATIFINNVERETEKAMLINVNVSFNANKTTERDLWFPKSVIESIDEHIAEVKDWFISNVEQKNAYKGYPMVIEKGF